MNNILTKNWDDVVLSGTWNWATAGTNYTSALIEREETENLRVGEPTAIKKITCLLPAANAGCPCKICLVTVPERKLIYISEVITEQTTDPISGGFYITDEPDFIVKPETGYFAVGFMISGKMNMFTTSSSESISPGSMMSWGYNTAKVGDVLTLHSGAADNRIFGMKIEFDDEISTPEPEPVDMKLHILLKKEQTVNLTGYMWPVGDNPPNLIWSSEDASIASVDQNGMVTANSVGKTKIYVQNEDGSFKAFARIKVVEEGEDELLLSILLEVGEECILVPEFDPEEAETAVLWTSSDGGIATVNAVGKVTGVSEGLAIITAQTADGKLSDSMYVTVKPQA